MGVWRKCITAKVTDMPAGWLDRAGVIVVGETARDVSNNHDVMSLEVWQSIFKILRILQSQKDFPLEKLKGMSWKPLQDCCRTTAWGGMMGSFDVHGLRVCRCVREAAGEDTRGCDCAPRAFFP